MPNKPPFLIIAALALCFAAPATARDDAPVPFNGVKWLKRPATYHVNKVFPRKAAIEKLNGDVTLRCRIAATGRVRDCVIVAETPGGYGFGASALKLAPIYKLSVVGDAAALVGRSVTIPVAFRLPTQVRAVAS